MHVRHLIRPHAAVNKIQKKFLIFFGFFEELLFVRGRYSSIKRIISANKNKLITTPKIVNINYKKFLIFFYFL